MTPPPMREPVAPSAPIAREADGTLYTVVRVSDGRIVGASAKSFAAACMDARISFVGGERVFNLFMDQATAARDRATGFQSDGYRLAFQHTRAPLDPVIVELLEHGLVESTWMCESLRNIAAPADFGFSREQCDRRAALHDARVIALRNILTASHGTGGAL